MKGATDKTFNWVNSTDDSIASANIDLAGGKTYKINNVDRPETTGLGSTVVSSSLTSIGTLGTTVSGVTDLNGFEPHQNKLTLGGTAVTAPLLN